MLPPTHSSLCCHSTAVVAAGVSPVGHPPRQGRAGTERVWWQCWQQGGCAMMGHNSPLRHSLSFPLWQFHPEDTVRTCPHLPGTAGHDPAAVTPGKAPGSRRCSWGGLEPRATLLGPCVCAREGSRSPPALGTQHQQPHLISRENEAQGYRVIPGHSGLIHHLASSLGVRGHTSHLQGPRIPPPEATISPLRLLLFPKGSED